MNWTQVLSASVAWLNANAGAIQTMATVVLVVITWRYVHLTKRLADAAMAEVDHRKSERRARKSETLGLIRLVRSHLDRLPRESGPGVDDIVRRVDLWRDEDLSHLSRLIAHFGEHASQFLAVAIRELRWMRDRIEEVRQVDARTGFHWERFPWKKWAESWSLADQMLGTVHGIAEKAVDD